MRPIDLPPADLETVRRILRDHAPGLEARAFGSRVSWTARDTSDLDLVLMTETPLDAGRMAALRAAFTGSDLPFRVDVADWAAVSENFRAIIEREYAVLSSVEPTRERRGWPTVEIGEIADIVGGGTPSTKDPANFDGDIPWLTPRDLSAPHGRVVTGGRRNLSRAGLSNSSAKLVPPGAVLLSTRAPVGYVAIAGTEIATNQGFRNLVVRDGACPEFVFYWLNANTQELERHATGTTFRELSGAALKRIRIPFPTLSEQRAIAEILGALDDKLELNRRMNETLEAMARAIFDDWFVDFGPTRARTEGREPYLAPEVWRLFPDRIDTNTGSPEGWRLGVLGDIAASENRAVAPAEVAADTPYIGLEHMPRRSIALSRWGRADQVKTPKLRFDAGEFLFGRLRPYFHKVGIAPFDGICSTTIAVVRPVSQEWSAPVLACISSASFVDFADRSSTGTTMPQTSWEALSRYELAIPSPALAAAFGDAVAPMLDRIVANVRESHALADTRDSLLPRLMSGRLRLREAEKVAA